MYLSVQALDSISNAEKKFLKTILDTELFMWNVIDP